MCLVCDRWRVIVMRWRCPECGCESYNPNAARDGPPGIIALAFRHSWPTRTGAKARRP